MPPVAEGVAVTVLVVHSGSWPPPIGSGALGTPWTSCRSCAISLAVSGHDANTSAPDELASQVVNMAPPTQFAGVQFGYTSAAMAVNSLTVAAAVVGGDGVGAGV